MTQDAQGFNAPITEDDIANYLVNTPDFFERHAQILAAVELTSPHNHRTISLQERQAEIMRGKIRELELAQSHMVRFGQNNVAIADKLNDWTVALLGAREAADVVAVLTRGLAEAYDFSAVELRWWAAPEDAMPESVRATADGELATAVAAMAGIVCGALEGGPVLQMFSAPESLASWAVVPLRDAQGGNCGVLALASDDAQRFTPDMGTLFLARVGALATAALGRFAPAVG